jgi:hypothetical protein
LPKRGHFYFAPTPALPLPVVVYIDHIGQFIIGAGLQSIPLRLIGRVCALGIGVRTPIYLIKHEVVAFCASPLRKADPLILKIFDPLNAQVM